MMKPGPAELALTLWTPFIPGNVIKMFVMVLLAGKFIPVIKNYLG